MKCDIIPFRYGILYMAKVLKLSLEAKFPSIPEKDLLKVCSLRVEILIVVYVFL